MEIKNKLQNSEQLDGWTTNHKGFVYYKGTLAIADSLDPQETLMTEAYQSKFVIHPGSTKMYQDLKRQYWWKHMRRDITHDIPTGESQAPETFRFATTTIGARMEVGQDHRFHDGVTNDIP